MNQERATGIVLRVRPLTETSLIVHWLTPDLGRLSTVAKGARRPKSPFRGQIDLFYLAEFSFARSKRSDLHTLREVKLVQPHALIRQELDWLEQAAYCANLIEQTTETETPLPGFYELFTGLLEALPQAPPQSQTVFAFELKLLEELGLQPNLAEIALSPGSKQILEKLVQLDWPAILRFRLSDAQIAEIRNFLQGFIRYHLERIPKSRNHAIKV